MDYRLTCLKSVDSTNLYVKNKAKENEPEGLVVRALTQTNGMGRSGREWNSTEKESLYFSILVRPEFEASIAPRMTLVMALAVTKAIRRLFKKDAYIKWPNDIVVDSQKVCGILTQMYLKDDGKIDFCVIGVGVNIKENEIVADENPYAGFLGDSADAGELLDEILLEWDVLFEKFKATDFSDLKEEYEEVLINKGKAVKVQDPNGEFVGMAMGVDENGGLIVECDGKTITVESGEISVRGLYGYV